MNNSALIIDHKDLDNTSVVDIELNLQCRLNRISNVASNVTRRQIDLDLNSLVSTLYAVHYISFLHLFNYCEII